MPKFNNLTATIHYVLNLENRQQNGNQETY